MLLCFIRCLVGVVVIWCWVLVNWLLVKLLGLIVESFDLGFGSDDYVGFYWQVDDLFYCEVVVFEQVDYFFGGVVMVSVGYEQVYVLEY